ncbi:flagellin lysine-N-methylase [[Clostridium] fimetarium]|uniref:Lysine-N-methylase n=1 Tax=[Clostridium] fimetarium TaxID=99656 RepID=A0A1I0N667_9FIRM|nr:flagellin lysine-N-methylase [[Clostridium] fimetarium]SEV96327.1 lysine-N-methylase [[Clostridium] fimetarium]
MRIRVPHYYKNFKCIGAACTDTCCAGWEVVIDEKSYKFYKTVQGDFGQRLKATMISTDENSFILQNGNCPFLNENKLCDIYTELGEDKLCETCKTYPRFLEEFGDLREIGISLSCMEAAKLIIGNQEPVTFELENNNEIITTYNNINPELFMNLYSARKVTIDILQNRSIDLNSRIALIIAFTQDIQEKIDRDKLSQISDVKKKYAKVDFVKNYINELDRYKDNALEKYENMSKYMNIFRNLEMINDNWPHIINRDLECLHNTNAGEQFFAQQYSDFDAYYQDKTYEFENLLVYFVFRYYLKSVYDEDVLSKVKMAVVSVLIIKELDIVRWIDNGYKFEEADQIDIIHMYSKEIEHSDLNLEALAQALKSNEIFDMEQLIIMLMN